MKKVYPSNLSLATLAFNFLSFDGVYSISRFSSNINFPTSYGTVLYCSL